MTESLFTQYTQCYKKKKIYKLNLEKQSKLTMNVSSFQIL